MQPPRSYRDSNALGGDTACLYADDPAHPSLSHPDMDDEIGVRPVREDVAAPTVATAMEVVVDQCHSRCLTDTATWIGEMLLDATPRVLAEPLGPRAVALRTLLARDSAHSVAGSGVLRGDGGRIVSDAGPSGALPRHPTAPSRAGAATAAARWRGYHQTAVGLFHRAEYERCHHLLLRAMREGEAGSVKRTRGEESADTGMDRENGARGLGVESGRHGRGRPGGGGGSVRRGRAGESEAPAVMATDESDGGVDAIASAAAFATTPLPPSLSFLSLYALYMDGQRVRTVSANPHRARNPHLRVLRVLLLEALRNPVNHLAVSGAPSLAGEALRSSGSPQRGRPGPSPRAVSPAHLARCDPYLTWLAGVVMRELGMKQESATYLLASVGVNPLLWCAWEEMALLVSRESQLEEIAQAMGDLQPRFMLDIFLALARTSLGILPVSASTPNLRAGAGGLPARAGLATPASATSSPIPTAVGTATTAATTTTAAAVAATAAAGGPAVMNAWELLLQESFPNNLFLLGQLAGLYYHHHKDLDKAERIYQRIHRADPYCLDYVADYSNLLFIKSDRLALASLAQRVYPFAPFSSEANFVVGNYYVLLGQHDRSVLHFRRAVAMRPGYVAAWTLLGHAYVETRNTTAAVEAYRTAVELDPRDYRGWYNLGQIYELLQAHHHALYYYWQTTLLRPTDPRMWTAVANCLEHEGRLGESITCLERAASYEPPTSELYPALVKRIAVYYIDIRFFGKACEYLARLASCPTASREDLVFALPFLVQYHVRQAHDVVGLPARSPSYEPQRGTAVPRPSAMLRKESPAGRVSGQTSTQSPVRCAGKSLPPHAGGGGVDSVLAPVACSTDAASGPAPRSTIALHHLDLAEGFLETLSALTRWADGVRSSSGGGGGEEMGGAGAEAGGSAGVTVPWLASSCAQGGGAGVATLAGPETGGARDTSALTGPMCHVEGFIRRMRREVEVDRGLIAMRQRP